MRILEFSEAEKKTLCRQAPEFMPLVRSCDLPPLECPEDLFYALAESIIAQQLAVRAAEVIAGRVKKLLGEVTAERVLAAEEAALRACGLSGRKTEYLRGIAEAKLSGRVDFEALAEKPDAEVIAELTGLKGVGVWTAEMLLIFALGRKDVLSVRDLGIRRGIMLLNGKESLSAEELEACRRRYSPCGTLASLYLWRLKDGGVRL